MREPITIVGAGIVGLATAYQLLKAGARGVRVLEAEAAPATQQTGHNSGVIHSGLYYAPGSLKARYCVQGRDQMYRFCAEHAIPHERCGKLVVAVTEAQQPALQKLEERGRANGLADVQRLTLAQMREREPHVAGVAGLLVPDTGIVDFVAVAQKLAELIEARGGEIQYGARLTAVKSDGKASRLETTAGDVRATHWINCAGLYSDHVARLAGQTPRVRIIPFRGEYVRLKPAAEGLVRHLIYPVPDPRFPFLGVHFTRMATGGVEAGPNALLTFRRQWYEPGDPASCDFSVLRYGGFWRMALRYGAVGLEELWRARSLKSFVAALQQLVPDIQTEDVEPYGSGIRAQAVDRKGKLLDDFHVMEAPGQIHVLNAPSPAATACLSIGRHICDLALKRFSA